MAAVVTVVAEGGDGGGLFIRIFQHHFRSFCRSLRVRVLPSVVDAVYLMNQPLLSLRTQSFVHLSSRVGVDHLPGEV
jgi:hypothetical protein